MLRFDFPMAFARSETDPRSSLRVALALGAGRPCLEDWDMGLAWL